MKEFSISTNKKRQMIDVTDNINKALEEMRAEDGICQLMLMHTTAAITVMEAIEENGSDLLDALDSLVPRLKYRHDSDPEHPKSHIMSSIIGASKSIPVKGGALYLGTWQRVALLEFDGPRERTVQASFIKG
jgi:secondary thiamine-phosphate synthase enzyme